MEQKLGSVFYIVFFLFASLCAEPNINVKVTDVNGQQLEELGIQIPFVVNVEISGEGAGSSMPSLNSSPFIEFAPAGTSSSIRTVNGNTKIKKNYRFTAKVYKEGTYTIGPVTIENGEALISSKSIILQATYNQKIAMPAQHEKAFIKIISEKDSAYRGERIPFVLRFYHLDSVRLNNIQEPTFSGCTATPLKGPTSGQETINGVVYDYLEWKCFLFPHTSGSLTVAPIGAQISISEKVERDTSIDVFSMMDQMMGAGMKRKTIYSNPFTINVQDLPEHDSVVTAVGSFSGLTAKVNLESATEGEGIVYTLELVGSGNFSMIGHPDISLPEGLKFYESNTKFKNLASLVYKKDYEYIVQGLQPGQYTIPSQSLTFFDIKQKVYKTLKTKPINITILASAVSENKNILEKPAEPVQRNDEIFSIDEDVRWWFREPRFISWLWFFLLAALPLFITIAHKLFGWWKDYQDKNAPHYGYKNAFKKAFNQIEICRRSGKVSDLYPICIELFAARLKLPKNEISEARIERALEERGMSIEKIASWRNFFADINAANFAFSTADKENLCTVLAEWITKFEKVL